MRHNEFKKHVLSRLKEVQQVLVIKGEEYAKDSDRLKNFKDAAEFNECTEETVLWGYVTKHIVALKDFIQDLENGKSATQAQWEEKFGDIINYMLILETLLIENGRYDENSNV